MLPIRYETILRVRLAADFMNNSGLRWIIHELRLQQMLGMEGKAVVYYREIRHNEADAVRSARP